MVYLTDFIKGCTIFRNYWMLNACMCLCMFASWVQWFLFAVKKHVWLDFSSVQLLCCVQVFATPWTAGRQASLSITNYRSLLKFISIESVMPSNISSSVDPFSYLQSFPASGSFLKRQFFTSTGPRTGASASVLSMVNFRGELTNRYSSGTLLSPSFHTFTCLWVF